MRQMNGFFKMNTKLFLILGTISFLLFSCSKPVWYEKEVLSLCLSENYKVPVEIFGRPDDYKGSPNNGAFLWEYKDEFYVGGYSSDITKITNSYVLTMYIGNSKLLRCNYVHIGHINISMGNKMFFPLAELLHSSREGNPEDVKKILDKNSGIKSVRRNLILPAIEAAKNNNVEVVAYFVDTYNISPNERISSWIMLEEEKKEFYSSLLGSTSHLSARVAILSIRDAAKMYNSGKVLEYLNSKK